MAILKEIHDTFDIFPKCSYTDHSFIDRILIKKSPTTGNYVITTFPGGCGSAFDGLAIEMGSVGQLFGDHGPHYVNISRDLGETLVLNLSSAVSDDNGGVKLEGTIPLEVLTQARYIGNEDPDFILFERLYTEIQHFRPTLQRLLTAYMPNTSEVAHFEFDFTDSLSYKSNHKTTDVGKDKVFIADEQEKGIYVELDATRIISDGEPGYKYLNYQRGILKKMKKFPDPPDVHFSVTGEEIGFLNRLFWRSLREEQLRMFVELEREMKSLYR